MASYGVFSNGIKKLSFFFLLSLFLVNCPSQQRPVDYTEISVVETIDGDTVKLANGKLLRYVGIDTPEMRLKQGEEFIYSPQPFAKNAMELNQRLVEGKSLRVEFDAEKYDTYGRLLGYCFVNNIFVNAVLVEQGLAVVYSRPPNIKYAAILLAAQKEARQEKKGLWVDEEIDQSQAFRYINQIRAVKGKVAGTYQSNNCVFLNFGDDYKKDFTVVIFKESLKYFKKENIDPANFYNGKIITVSGKIREHNGPEIIVNMPGEVEVIN